MYWSIIEIKKDKCCADSVPIFEKVDVSLDWRYCVKNKFPAALLFSRIIININVNIHKGFELLVCRHLVACIRQCWHTYKWACHQQQIHTLKSIFSVRHIMII